MGRGRAALQRSAGPLPGVPSDGPLGPFRLGWRDFRVYASARTRIREHIEPGWGGLFVCMKRVVATVFLFIKKYPWLDATQDRQILFATNTVVACMAMQ